MVRDETSISFIPRIAMTGHQHPYHLVLHRHLREPTDDGRIDPAAEAHSNSPSRRRLNTFPNPIGQLCRAR